MKPITLHPVSVLVGLALAGLLTVLAGAAQSSVALQGIPSRGVRGVGGNPTSIGAVPEGLDEIPASWWVTAKLETAADGTVISSYTIPTDRYLVLTLLDGPGSIKADGVDLPGQEGVYDLPVSHGTRVVLQPGTFLTTNIACRLWGYLEPVGEVPANLGEIPASWWVTAHLETTADGTVTTSYTVPPDRYLVLTLLDMCGWDSLRANGVFVDGQDGVNRNRFHDNHGSRVVLQPGTLLTAENPPDGHGRSGQLWGYLEPVR